MSFDKLDAFMGQHTLTSDASSDRSSRFEAYNLSHMMPEATIPSPTAANCTSLNYASIGSPSDDIIGDSELSGRISYLSDELGHMADNLSTLAANHEGLRNELESVARLVNDLTQKCQAIAADTDSCVSQVEKLSSRLAALEMQASNTLSHRLARFGWQGLSVAAMTISAVLVRGVAFYFTARDLCRPKHESESGDGSSAEPAEHTLDQITAQRMSQLISAAQVRAGIEVNTEGEKEKEKFMPNSQQLRSRHAAEFMLGLMGVGVAWAVMHKVRAK